MSDWPDWHFAKSIRLPHESYDNRDATFHLVTSAAVGTVPFNDRVLGERVWRALCRESERNSVVLVAACLMPDHLHVLARPWEENAADWFGEFKSLTTRFAWSRGKRGPLWQPSFYDRQLRSGEISIVVAYILRNPETAGLAEELNGWPWSGAWAEA